MTMQRQVLRLFGIGLALVLLALGACGGQTLSPRFQPEISNVTDNFQFQATAMTNVSQTLTYTWQNTGISANVNQASSVTGGSADVLIRDAQSTVVYTANLATNGTFVTNNGTAGAWTIQVALSGCNGTVNFRVQKRTP